MLGTIFQKYSITDYVSKLSLRTRWRGKFYKPNVKNYFNGDTMLARKTFTWFQKRYYIRRSDAFHLFNTHPRVFRYSTKDRILFEKRMDFIQATKKQHPLLQHLGKNIFKNTNVIFDLSEKEIVQILEGIERMQIPYHFAEKLISACPNLFSLKFEQIIKNKMEIIRNYLNISDEQIYAILGAQPFILNASDLRLTESLHYFMEHRKHISVQDLKKLMSEMAEVFLIGRNQLTLLVKWYIGWGISHQKLWPILLKNPLLFFNSPTEIAPLKIRLFRHFRFTCKMGQEMLEKYPIILICSISSLEARLLFVRDRFKLPIDINTLELLRFKFIRLLRPRGEILLKKKKILSAKDILDFMKMSNTEFCRAMQIRPSQLRKEIFKFEQTPEIDFLKKKIYKGRVTQNKFEHLADRYYHDADDYIFPPTVDYLKRREIYSSFVRKYRNERLRGKQEGQGEKEMPESQAQSVLESQRQKGRRKEKRQII